MPASLDQLDEDLVGELEAAPGEAEAAVRVLEQAAREERVELAGAVELVEREAARREERRIDAGAQTQAEDHALARHCVGRECLGLVRREERRSCSAAARCARLARPPLA